MRAVTPPSSEYAYPPPAHRPIAFGSRLPSVEALRAAVRCRAGEAPSHTISPAGRHAQVKAKDGKTPAMLEEVLSTLPEGMDSSFNLGSADIYPATSGKHRAARYLMQHYGATEASSVCVCVTPNMYPAVGVSRSQRRGSCDRAEALTV